MKSHQLFRLPTALVDLKEVTFSANHSPTCHIYLHGRDFILIWCFQKAVPLWNSSSQSSGHHMIVHEAKIALLLGSLSLLRGFGPKLAEEVFLLEALSLWSLTCDNRLSIYPFHMSSAALKLNTVIVILTHFKVHGLAICFCSPLWSYITAKASIVHPKIFSTSSSVYFSLKMNRFWAVILSSYASYKHPYPKYRPNTIIRKHICISCMLHIKVAFHANLQFWIFIELVTGVYTFHNYYS